MLDGCTSDGEDAIGGLLARGEPVGAAGGEAGDDHGVANVVVQATETEVCRRPDTSGAQVSQDVVVAGGGDVVGAAGPGGGYPDQTASLVGQGKEVQAVMVVFAGVVSPVGFAGAALGGDEGAVDETTSSPCLVTFLRARSRRGVWSASSLMSSSRRRRTVDSDTSLPPAMSARR